MTKKTDSRYVVRCAELGAVSSGTLDPVDLLWKLSSELDYQLSRQAARFPRREMRKIVRKAERARDLESEDMPDLLDELLDELFEALETFAPPHAYFGGSEGDPADIGYWLSMDIFHCRDCFDGLRVDDLADVPCDYAGEILHVNDHGNATLYTKSRTGKPREVWSVV